VNQLASARPLAGIIYLPTTGRAEEDDPFKTVYTPRNGRTTRSGPSGRTKSYPMVVSIFTDGKDENPWEF
jgi:hypothetical protein